MQEKKYKGHTWVPNKIIRDERISLSSRGLLIYMISCPPNWKFTQDSLIRETNTKVTKLRTNLDQLESLGYIKRKITREKGKIKSFNWEIMQNPNENENYDNGFQILEPIDDDSVPF